MMNLEQIIAVVNDMLAQGIFTQQQATRLIDAATSILKTFGGAEEYLGKYNFFLALISGKWL